MDGRSGSCLKLKIRYASGRIDCFFGIGPALFGRIGIPNNLGARHSRQYERGADRVAALIDAMPIVG